MATFFWLLTVWDIFSECISHISVDRALLVGSLYSSVRLDEFQKILQIVSVPRMKDLDDLYI